jgi:HK97 family phage portal protein
MGVVASGGQVVAVGRGESLTVARSISLYGGRSESYEAIWRSQPQVRTVTSFLARNIAQLGIHVFRRVGDTERERLADHPIASTLSRPNPDTTRYELIDALVHDLAIYDNAYWLKIRRTDGGVGLLRLPPRRVEPRGDNWLTPEQYRLTGSRGWVDYTADQVVHFRGYNPTDPRIGVSPIETLRRILAEEAAAATYREQLWRSGARAASVITRPVDAPQWSEAARSRFLLEWRAQYSGDGPHAGGTAILEDGMSLEGNAFSAEQAQYIQARKLTREEVAAAYHIPLPMVGILDHATFSNITEQHKQLYQDTLAPWLTAITQRIELRLLPEYADTDRVYLEFNLAEKLRGSFEEQATSMQTMVGAPVMTRNEGRARLNLPPLDGGDLLVTPLNVLIGGQASPTDSAPRGRITGAKARAPQRWDEKYAEVLTKFFDRQAKAVLAKLGASKARGKASAAIDDVFDRDRWNTELAADLYTVNVGAAVAAARQVLEEYGTDPDEFDEDTVLAWLAANADGVATGINDTTADQLAEALAGDDPVDNTRRLFEIAVASRAAQIAVTQATAMNGFGSSEGAKTVGLTTKTWVTRSARPRPSHARMDGETVAINERFSNGARWPGDSTLSPDERAGCMCDLRYGTE